MMVNGYKLQWQLGRGKNLWQKRWIIAVLVMSIIAFHQTPMFTHGYSKTNRGNTYSTTQKLNSAVVSLQGPSDYEKLVDTSSDHLMIFNFYKSSCRPCVRWKPLFEKVADKYREVASFYSLDGEDKDSRQLMKSLGVTRVPTYAVLYKGVHKIVSIGSNLAELEQQIEQNLNLSQK